MAKKSWLAVNPWAAGDELRTIWAIKGGFVGILGILRGWHEPCDRRHGASAIGRAAFGPAVIAGDFQTFTNLSVAAIPPQVPFHALDALRLIRRAFDDG